MTFYESIFALAFGAEGVYQGAEESTMLAFATASAVYGFLVVSLDFLIVKTLNKASILALSYVGYKSLGMFLMWGLGSGIGGLLGAGFGIFEVNRTACIFVGVGWPLILPRLLSSANSELSTEKIEISGV
ncbi:hypothetical protein [Vibrio penaeicida]|uniref:hypothetical protein n=1 Tax=Vibrio penaeicida TaxID=104609 RepID=UPI000CE9C1A3|nr:hypothetical protein [Vibrio penaeicida]